MTGLLSLSVLLVVAGEMLAFFWAPTWLARLAFVKLAPTRRITLPRRPDAIARGSYRDAAIEHAPMPSLDLDKTYLGDAVLVRGSRESFALRRLYAASWAGRFYYLVRIDLAVEGAELVMRARQVLFPISLPFVAGIYGLLSASHGRWGPLGIAAVWSVILLAGTFLVRHSRDAAIEEAYDVIEREALASARVIDPGAP